MVELLIALPMFVLFIFIIAELSRLHEAKSILDVAALSAARAGAIQGGDPGHMRFAAATAMAPLYVTDEAGVGDVAAAILKAQMDTSLPHLIGSNSIDTVPLSGSFNGLPGGGQQGIRIEILSPTPQMVSDFGVVRLDADGQATHTKVIPNDNLTYRSTALKNDVNVQDANLLKIKVTYLYETKMPLTRYFFTPLMNANLTRVLFGGESVGSMADAPTGWRIPLVSYVTVRMQSDFREGSLSAAGTPTNPGTSGTPGTPGGTSGTPGTPGGTPSGQGGAGDPKEAGDGGGDDSADTTPDPDTDVSCGG
jgi:hypothetical protein